MAAILSTKDRKNVESWITTYAPTSVVELSPKAPI